MKQFFKRSLPTLLLAAALLSCLLAGCTPTPDQPGGASSSGASSTTEPDTNGDHNINAPKLEPTVLMEASNINYNPQKKAYVVSCVFRVTNNSSIYQLSKTKISLTLTDGAGKTERDYTMIPTLAPGDTIRFVYLRTCTNSHPTQVDYTFSTMASGYQVPEQDETGARKVVRSSDLQVLNPSRQKNEKVDSDSFSATIRNNSKCTCQVKVSLILKKEGKAVSADAATLFLTLPAGGSGPVNILHGKDVSYDSFEIVATPWQQ